MVLQYIVGADNELYADEIKQKFIEAGIDSYFEGVWMKILIKDNLETLQDDIKQVKSDQYGRHLEQCKCYS